MEGLGLVDYGSDLDDDARSSGNTNSTCETSSAAMIMRAHLHCNDTRSLIHLSRGLRLIWIRETYMPVSEHLNISRGLPRFISSVLALTAEQSPRRESAQLGSSGAREAAAAVHELEHLDPAATADTSPIALPAVSAAATSQGCLLSLGMAGHDRTTGMYKCLWVILKHCLSQSLSCTRSYGNVSNGPRFL